MCAPFSHGDIVTEAKKTKKNHLKLGFVLFLKVIFGNHYHFSDLYNQYDNFLRRKIFHEMVPLNLNLEKLKFLNMFGFFVILPNISSKMSKQRE